MNFNSLSDLFKHIQKNIDTTLLDEVADEVRHEEQRQIQKEVYDAYPLPYVYERRRYNEGGLQDRELMVATLQKRGNEVVLSVVNMAKGDNQEDLYIAPLVEYGDNKGYGEYNYKYNRDHTSWKYLQSRPFTEATVDALQRSGKAAQGMREGLSKRGLIVK